MRYMDATSVKANLLDDGIVDTLASIGATRAFTLPFPSTPRAADDGRRCGWSRLDQRRISVAERPVVAACAHQADEDVLAPQIEALIQLVDHLLVETALLFERAALGQGKLHEDD